MFLYKPLPLSIVLLLVDFAAGSASYTLVPRAVHDLREHAVRRTHSLAQDIRVAFGGVLVPRAADDPASRHVVYCKSGPPKQVILGGGGGSPSSGGGDNRTIAVPGGSTYTPPSAPSPSSSAGSSNAAPRTSSSTKGAPTPVPPPPPSSASSPWKLVESHQGQNFFDGWNFFLGADPTHGTVTYIDQNTARSAGLLEVNSAGNAIMRVETTPVVPVTRQSVRIQTQRQLNGGLIIMDAVHMPHGCGVWPAFWTNGPNWPFTGEIDILEGVGDYTNNQATVHTDVGCTLSSTSANQLAISGSVIGGTDCAALTTGNQGCGIRASTSNSYGSGFNAAGGGVYAMQWDGSGIAVYFFPAGSVPADISSGAPQPSTWGLAQARWPATSCDPFKFFINHSAIFDTTLCGDWASGVWNSAGIPGQEQSCAQRTGVSTCEAFVKANGGAMAEAYWEVRSVKIYQSS